MDEIITFTNSSLGSVRVVEKDNEPWFIAADICKVLGYVNPRKAIIDHVDDEDKNTVTIRDGNKGNPNSTVINESGLYSLILSSKLPQAKQFKRWVTSEVLPSIRKKGSYNPDSNLPWDDPGKLQKMLFKSVERWNIDYEERLRLEKETASQKKLMAADKPKVEYYNEVLSADGTLTTTEIAKDFGMTAQDLNQYLKAKKVQFKHKRGTWLLYAKYQNMGLTKTSTYTYSYGGKVRCSLQTYWTQKGRQFIYNLLKEDGLLPDKENLNGNPV